MSYTIEEILAAKMVSDQQAADPAVGMAVGAVGGGLAGLAVGDGVHQAGRGLNFIGDHVPGLKMIERDPDTRKPIKDKDGRTRQIYRGTGLRNLKPGNRMAGGLIGTILGGGLGLGVAEAMRTSSDAGKLLSDIHEQGMTPKNEAQLQRALTYNTY